MTEDNDYEDVVRFSRKPRSKSSFVQNFYGVPGHIYIARNDAHRDGIYKIGLTTRRNPQARIDELNRQARDAGITGHIGELELIESFETIDCGRAESAIHARLSDYRYVHNREFFEHRFDEIVEAINAVLEDIERTVLTTGKTPHQLAYEKEKERQELMAAVKAAREAEERKRQVEDAIRRRYAAKLEAHFPQRPFWNFWLVGAILVFVLLAMFGNESLVGAIFFGAFVGVWLSSHFDDKRRHSAGYKAMEAERDREIELARSDSAPEVKVDLICPGCLKELCLSARFARSGKIVRCPVCKITFDCARALPL